MARRRGVQVERVFEQSHVHEEVRAGAYEILVPVRRVALRREKECGETAAEGLREARGA